MLEGGGVEKLFGQNPFEQHLSFQGASLSFARLFAVEKLSFAIEFVSEKKVMPITVLFAFFVYFGIAATFYF